MSYVYSYKTDLGEIPRFTSEDNTLADLMPEGRYGSYAQPSQSFKDTGNAVIVQPVAGSPGIITKNGVFVSKEEMIALVGKRLDKGPGEYIDPGEYLRIGEKIDPGEYLRFGEKIRTRTGTSTGTPIILGQPVDIQYLSDEERKNITYIPIDIGRPTSTGTTGIIGGGVLIAVVIIVIAAICIAAVASVYIMNAWATGQIAVAEQERQKTLQAQADLIAQRQTRTSHEEYDLNGDGVNDKAIDTWGNGESLTYAISDYGVGEMGTEVETIKSAEPLPEGFMEAAICPMGSLWNATTKKCEEYTPYWEKTGYENLIMWGIIGVAVIGGVIVAVKVIPSLLKKKKGGT